MTIPEDASALVVVINSSRLDGTGDLLLAVGRDLGRAGLATGMFEDLQATRTRSDPLSFFDTNVMAAHLLAIVDALADDSQLGALPLGLFAVGGAAAAAVVAAAGRPARIGALVLVNAALVAASTSLPDLAAPTLLLLPRPAQQEEGFLATGSRRSVRQLGLLPGSAGRAVTSERLRMVAHRATVWFQRHLLARN